MKRVALVAVVLVLAACAKKEEAPVAEVAPAADTAMVMDSTMQHDSAAVAAPADSAK